MYGLNAELSGQCLKKVQIEGARLERSCKCRLAAFDNVRQVQVAGLLVHRPDSADDFKAPDKRSV